MSTQNICFQGEIRKILNSLLSGAMDIDQCTKEGQMHQWDCENDLTSRITKTHFHDKAHYAFGKIICTLN